MDPSHLFPYVDIFLPSIKTSLFDSQPDVRAAIAKGLGSLTRGLGSPYLEEIIDWLKSYLCRDIDTVQRSGSAQAFSEIFAAYGEEFIDIQMPELVSTITEGDEKTKEGFLSVFVFLPGALEEKFEKYFPIVFPLIIDAFSSSSEAIRAVSNRIFEICIKT